MRGVSLSATGLASSAEYSCAAPKPTSGATATKRTTIPIPPAHWVRLRQSNREDPTFSGGSVAAPVVVKPAMELKNASTVPMSPERTNGNDPTAATLIQPETTIRKTSCLETYPCVLRRVRK